MKFNTHHNPWYVIFALYARRNCHTPFFDGHVGAIDYDSFYNDSGQMNWWE